MGGGARRRYSREFRRDAVGLVRASGRSVRSVAQELGVNDGTLGAWIREAAQARDGGRTKEVTGLNGDEEMRQLRRRVAELETEREILKRALAFWVKESTG